MKATLKWQSDMSFQCENHGLNSITDASPEHGGKDLGPSPKELLLNAMMGCTAMDVVTILKKMREPINTFLMEIEVEKTLLHPVHFKWAKLSYHLTGEIDPQKIIKAVNSSLTKYCGVNYIISKTCHISYQIFLNGNFVSEGNAEFIEPTQN
jgi:putative redox protein